MSRRKINFLRKHLMALFEQSLSMRSLPGVLNCCNISQICVIIIFFTPVLNSQGVKKMTLCNTEKYKNQAGMNLTPPPPSLLLLLLLSATKHVRNTVITWWWSGDDEADSAVPGSDAGRTAPTPPDPGVSAADADASTTPLELH